MALFGSLSERLNHIFSKLTKRGKLTELEIRTAMREVRVALLEADVNLRVAKQFIAEVSEKAVGQEILSSLNPAQQVIKIVNEELIALMGSKNAKLEVSSKLPTVIMMCGLQGAGKTTLVKSILGEIHHEGTVSYESHDGDKINNITIGYVPQHLDFDRSAPISVEDFLLVGRTNSPVCFLKNKKIKKDIDNALEIVGCKDLKYRKLGSLSGGELQRVMLANALYPLPELLLLDEPVSGVDAAGSEKFYEVIKDLKQNYHMAIAMVSHDLGIVRDFADNVVLINKSVLKSGNAKDVFNSPEFKSSFYSLSEGEAE